MLSQGVLCWMCSCRWWEAFSSLLLLGATAALTGCAFSSCARGWLQGMTPEALEPLEERFRTWYANMSRAGLDISMCVDAKAGLTEGTGQCVVRLSGAADDEALRETSPLILVNDLDLVPLGKAMRGDPPASQQQQQQQHIIYPVVR